MSRRVALASVCHRTNSFAARQTDWDEFTDDTFLRGEAMWAVRETATRIGAAIAELEKSTDLWEVIPLLAAGAPAGGPVAAEVFQSIADELIARLEAAQPEAMLLDFDGAMVTEDGERGDDQLLRRVRSALGFDTPLVVTVGPAAIVSQTMLDLAHVAPPPAANPVLSAAEHGAGAARRLLQLAGGRLTSVTELRRLPLLVPPSQAGPDAEPMRSLLDQAAARAHHADVIETSLVPGFAFADTPDTGFAVLVTTNGDRSLAARVAAELADLVWERRASFKPNLLSVEAAVHEAMAAPAGPWMLRDAGDDPSHGGPGDGTALLWALLDLGAPDAALGVLVDPEAVRTAFAAGIGATISVPLGAHTDEAHGFPVDLTATVRGLADGGDGSAGRLGFGRTAVLACEGRYHQVVEVIAGERRRGAVGPDIFARHGIDPAARKILVGKGSSAAAGELARVRTVDVDTPGVTTPDLRRLPYRRVRHPIWPLDSIE